MDINSIEVSWEGLKPVLPGIFLIFHAGIKRKKEKEEKRYT